MLDSQDFYCIVIIFITKEFSQPTVDDIGANQVNLEASQRSPRWGRPNAAKPLSLAR